MERNIPKNMEFRVLSEEKRKAIHEASLQLLENTGVSVTGDEMRSILEKGGAVMCEDNIVKFPREIVMKALSTVPHGFKIYNRDGELVGEVGDERNIYFGSISEQLEYLDYHTNEASRFRREQMKIMCILQDYLPNIQFTTSVGIMGDVPAPIAGQIGFIDTVRYFTKSIHVVTSDYQALEDIVEIAKDLAGGKEALIEKPNFIYYAEPIPPLQHPVESNKRLIICAENGIPCTYMPYTMMGGTGPITPAGILVQNNADILAGVVMHQLVRPGAPFIYGSMPTVLDMRTTIGAYGAPEFHRNIAAASEMAAFYNMPFYGTGAITDARVIDPQCMAELEMTLFSSMISEANFVHDIGLLDHCRNISPMAIYFANEIIEQLKHYVNGIEVNDSTMMLDVMDEIGPGGHYLEHMSTLKGFKQHWYPKVFTRFMVNPEKSDLLDRAIKEIDKIEETHIPTPLSPEKEAILAKHEAELFARIK